MECLAESITTNQKIAGIFIADQKHKVSLFADDVILMVTDPTNSLPEIQKMLAWFSDISNYTVNENKSYILNLGVNTRPSDYLKLLTTPH